MVFTAGACPLDEHGSVVGRGDLRLQARQVLANLTEALAAAGATLADVLKTTVYVASADRADLVAVCTGLGRANNDTRGLFHQRSSHVPR